MVDPIGAKSTLAAVAEPTGFPAGSVLDALVKTIDGAKRDSGQVLRVTVNEPLKHRRDQMNLLGKEQTKALEDIQWATKGLSIVSYGSLLYATATVLGGYYLRHTGEEASGDQFIKSGLILLSNTLMTHLDGWKQLARVLSLGNRTVEQVLELALPLVVTLFTQVWNARHLASLPIDDQRKIANIETLFRFVALPLEVAKLYMKYEKGQGERQLQYIDSEMSATNLDVNQLLLRRGRIQDTFDNIGSGMRRVVKSMFNTTADFAKNT